MENTPALADATRDYVGSKMAGYWRGVSVSDLIGEAFEAGAHWQATQPRDMPERLVPRGPFPPPPAFDPETAYKNTMAMLDQINKVVCEIQGAKVSIVCRSIDEGTGHVLDAIGELELKVDGLANKPVASSSINQDTTHRILGSIENRLIEIQGPGLGVIEGRLTGLGSVVVDVGQKVEGVRDAIDNWGNHLHDLIADDDDEATDEQPVDLAAVDPRSYVVGMDLAKPGSDVTVHTIRSVQAEDLRKLTEKIQRAAAANAKATAKADPALVDVDEATLYQRDQDKINALKSALVAEEIKGKFWREAAKANAQINKAMKDRIDAMGDLVDKLA